VRGVKRLSRLLGAFIERRPALLVMLALLLTALAFLGLMRLEFRSSQDMLISRHSKTFRHYERYSRQFGGDQVLILLSGDLEELLSPTNLDVMAALQEELEADRRVKLVISPLTFLNDAARKAARERGVEPRALLRDPGFIHSVVFAEDGSINPRLARVIPDDRHALMAVRLKGELDIDEQKAAAKEIRRSAEASQFTGASVLVAGTPLLLEGITKGIQRSMMITGLLAIVLMVVVLFLIFPARWRLLSLPVVLLGVLWTFGLMGFISMPITLVTMAGLPILIGLGVDYAIQFHNRYEEEIGRGDTPATAIVEAITHIGPAVGIAVFATALGFIALLISPVPMVRDFGIMITMGVIILYALGLFLLNALLYWKDKGRRLEHIRRRRAGASGVQRLLTGLARRAIRHPLPIIAVAVLLSGAGLYLDRHLPVQTSIERLIPPSTPALVDLNRARQVVGSTTEITVLVEGEDVTRPEVLRWMLRYQEEQLAKHPDLLTADSVATAVAEASGGVIPDKGRIEQILGGLPRPLQTSLVSTDRRAASISFGVRLIPIDRLNRLINEIGADAEPPPGITATPAGSAVLGARTVNALTANRELVTLVGLAAIALGLLLVYRSIARAAVPLLPIALVVGWSSGFMYLAGIELNPLTAVLGSLIIGIGTEFTVLLMERYYEEKEKGKQPLEAMVTAVSNIGQAITASGLTVVAGFSTLMASNFPILQDFGKTTVIDVLFALGNTLIVLPAAVIWLDGRLPSFREVLAGARALTAVSGDSRAGGGRRGPSDS